MSTQLLSLSVSAGDLSSPKSTGETEALLNDTINQLNGIDWGISEKHKKLFIEEFLRPARAKRRKTMRHRDQDGWQRSTVIYLDRINAVMDDMREYWPLTLRQVYYRLVGTQIIENNIPEYKKLSRILTKARLQGLVSLEAIEDRHRSSVFWRQYDNVQHFLDVSKKDFLAGYSRNPLQDQAYSYEVWVEKDALADLCGRAASTYGIPVIVAKGFSSISFLYKLKSRIETQYEDEDRPTMIIYLGDFDPSGWSMLPSMEHTLFGEMNVDEDALFSIRCALTEYQIAEHNLPHSPDAIKVKDPRAKEFVERFGEVAVELDALPPGLLMDILTTCIEDNLDMNKFQAQIKQQEKDERKIKRIRKSVEKTLEGIR